MATKTIMARQAAERERLERGDVSEPAPVWLSKRGQMIWETLDDGLRWTRCVTDGVALALFCDSLDGYLTAREIVNREGAVVQDKAHSGVKKHPAIAVMDLHRKAMIRLARELGLTPSSRYALGWSPGEDLDD